MDARKKIARVSVQAILDNTRNRLLTFLMELREQFPDLDISKSTSDSDKRQTAQILVTNHIYGNENIVASGREFTQNVTKSIKDLDSLLSRLQDLGVEPRLLVHWGKGKRVCDAKSEFTPRVITVFGRKKELGPVSFKQKHPPSFV